jgi:hypothetical protein
MRSTLNMARFIQAMLVLVILVSVSNMASAAGCYYYQIKIYHFKDKAQEQAVDAYLKDSYLPRLHRMGIKNVGVFKPLEADTAKFTYVFVPFKSWKDLQDFDSKLINSGDAAGGKDYVDADYKSAPYTRMETILLSAFSTRPSPMVPQLTAPKAERVYELRSYESPTEKYHYTKVKMFNSGETDLFDRIKSNPVFYGSVVAGSHMPNLMYLTAYNSMPERDKHWDAFSNAPEWKALVANDEYKNSVSKNVIVFLRPTEYSDY